MHDDYQATEEHGIAVRHHYIAKPNVLFWAKLRGTLPPFSFFLLRLQLLFVLAHNNMLDRDNARY